MIKRSLLKASLVLAIASSSACGAKTALNEPIAEGPRSVSCADSLSVCTNRRIVVSSSMLPASRDVVLNLNGVDVPSHFNSFVVNGTATATVEFGMAVRVDVFSPTNQVSFPAPGPTPNYLESPTALAITPQLVRLSFGTNSRPIQMGSERVFKCLRFRVGESSTPSLVNFGVFDSDDHNLGSGSVGAGEFVTFTAANQRLLLGNYEPNASDRFGFVLFANVVDITNGPVTVNSRSQPTITGRISSSGNLVTGFSVSIRDGNFTDCQ